MNELKDRIFYRIKYLAKKNRGIEGLLRRIYNSNFFLGARMQINPLKTIQDKNKFVSSQMLRISSVPNLSFSNR